MSEENKTAASGEGAEASKTSEKGATTLADLSPELQEQLTQLLTRKEKEWAKKNKETFDKASEFETLQKKLKEKEQAELSELEKLKLEKGELEPFKTRAESLEKALKAFYEAEIESIPEAKRTLIPDDLPLERKLEYISVNREHLRGSDNSSIAAKANAMQSGKADPLLEKVKQQAEELCKGKTPEYKEAFIKRQYESLKAQQTGLSDRPTE